MRKCILILILGLISLPFYAQEYYYYYQSEKCILELNTDYIFVSTIGNEDVKKKSNLLGKDSKTFVESKSNSLKQKYNTTKNIYWSEIKTNTLKSQKDYITLINELKESSETLTISPYFNNSKGDRIGLSNFFYVKLKAISDTVTLKQYANNNNVLVVSQNEFMPLWFTLSCTKSTTKNSMELANEFYESNEFEYAEPDFLYENLSFCTNDTHFGSQWNLRNDRQYGGTAGIDIKACSAWNKSTGENVTIAILDHGIQLNHPDLAANIHPLSYDTESSSSPSLIYGDHGTACAGIAGAVGNNSRGIIGVAPNCQLMSISNSLELRTTAKESLANGINWAWQNGADVISNSWGHNNLNSAIITDAITNAVTYGRKGRGCVVVFSSGNDNSSTVSYPAKLNNVITVGGISPCGQRKSPNSCDGENWGANYGSYLDVVAPAVLVPTTDRTGDNGYNPNSRLHPYSGGSMVSSDFGDTDYTIWFNGTSAAAPHVAGVAALVLSLNPNLTQKEVRNIIESTCRQLSGYPTQTNLSNGMWNNEVGYGLIDAFAAVSAVPAVPAKPYISGKSSLCRETETYTLHNIPSGSKVTWTTNPYLTPNSAPTPVFKPNSPTNNQCTVENRYNWSVPFTLIASINGTVVAKRDIVTEGTNTSLIGTYRQPNLSAYNTPMAIPSGTTYILHSQLTIFNFTNIAEKQVRFNGTNQPTSWDYNSSTKTLSVILPYGGGYYIFDIGEEGTCGFLQLALYASGAPTRLAEINEGVYDVELFDLLSGVKVYNEKKVDFRSFNVNSLNLKEGFYIIKLKNEDEIITEKVSISN